ncbi:hypothetical protein [Jannaschia sp. LMIT008]|uniref:hypothetical protein n=1 Tax=Jannaschia maritima TaxID=3032585 RepID=UPI002810C9A6|nr:hypothetical protein [Jannaschia sp. LMIT008]
MAVADGEENEIRFRNLLVDTQLKVLQLDEIEARIARRVDENRQFKADIDLKERQARTEFLKVAIALLAAGAVIGGVIVRLWTGA